MSVRFPHRVLLALALGACVEPTGPGEPRLGQLRLRPAFAPGESEAELRLTADSIHVRIARTGEPDALVDTVRPFERDAALGWILDLAGDEEQLPVRVELRSAGAVLWRGDSAVTAVAGRIGEAEVHELRVAYVGPARAASVVVTPASATLTAAGATQRFEAVVRDAQGAIIADAVVTWTSDAPAIATVDATSGVATAIANGGASIIAAAGAVEGSAALLVAIAGQPSTGRSTLEAAPAVLPADGTSASTITVRLLDPHGDPVGASGGVVTLSATLGTLSEVVDHLDGTYTATLASTVAGTSRVTGTLGGAAIADDAEVTFTPDDPTTPVLTTLEVAPALDTLRAAGATRAFSSVARDQTGAIMEGVIVAWESSDDAIATIDASTGIATAVANGTVTIRATADGVTGTATLTVAIAGQPSARHSTLTADPASIPADGTTAATITVRVLDALGAPVGTGGASVVLATTLGTLSGVTDRGDGTYTALLTGGADGTALVSGTLDGAPIADTAVVALTPVTPATPVLTRIDVEPATDTLRALGATRAFTAVARDQFGAEMPGVQVQWASGAPAVATIDATSGVVTAVANGTASITASASGVTGGATLVVRQRAASITLVAECVGAAVDDAEEGGGSPQAAPCDTLAALGDRVRLVATVRDSLGAPVEAPAITWASDDPGIATVDASGLVTATGNGTVLVRARVDGVEATHAVVVRQVVVSVVVEPAEVEVPLGQSWQLVAVARDANGAVVADAPIAWTSAEDSVVRVDQAGRVTALAVGIVRIKAWSGEVHGVAWVTVVP